MLVNIDACVQIACPRRYGCLRYMMQSIPESARARRHESCVEHVMIISGDVTTSLVDADVRAKANYLDV